MMTLVRDLTPCEVAIVELLSIGMHYKEIASELHCSPHTVKNHLQHIYVKLGMRGNVDVAVWWMTEGKSQYTRTD